MYNNIKILVADDHPLFREGVVQTINKYCNSEVALAEDGETALKKIIKEEPDIAILDLRMPGKTGLEILTELSNSDNTTKIILLTMYKNINYFYQAVAAGVKGYLLKETAVDELIEAVEKVGSGGTFISERLKKIIAEEKKDDFERKLLVDSINSLTKAEREVLKLLSDWKTNNEIAGILCNSIRTIENHRARISEKLNLHGIHSLIKFSIENKELF
ncbi:MAG: response regulator transcription factor [Melioribacteraceae bacterium]|nr:response regulator transcription factor [Melioribacteraceae bacterium]MCF8354246.1 response regulator transcription factor [Melioribacteraceae bacterium]MCF8394810.1 response regulator transcription factor [Melioribacteraceae bacterium]MCF8417977.1 response regulator transcription factor [Melioribacteraceae bacterium]